MKYILALLILTACDGKVVTRVDVSGAKDDFEVSFLFEKDGCKIYRFHDNRYHYFTNCTETITTISESCGKGCVRHFDRNIGGRK